MIFIKNKSTHAIIVFAFCNLAAFCQKPVQKTVDDIRIRYSVPALGGLIQKDEAIDVYISGVRKLGSTNPVLASDKFHLGSDTKAMTATQIAILIEKGKIRWDSKISDIFPEWSSAMDPEIKSVTLELLASHMSGITPDLLGFQDGALIKIATDPNLSIPEMRAEASKAIFTTAPIQKPGSHFEYSNMNYVILGAIIEKITGVSWEESIKSMIFKPLSMDSCGFGPPGDPDSVSSSAGAQRSKERRRNKAYCVFRYLMPTESDLNQRSIYRVLVKVIKHLITQRFLVKL